MSCSSIRAGLALCVLAAVPQGASAHFLWIVAGAQSPDGKAHVYFAEDASPDDPELLDRLGTLTVHQKVDGKLVALKAAKGKDSLVADPGEAKSDVYALNHSYGVMSRGNSPPFLLKYHAKCLTSTEPSKWTATAGAEALPFELVPRFDGEKLVVRTLWQGKPLPAGEYVVAFEGTEDIKGTADERGEFSFKLPAGKPASIRVKHVDKTKGEHDGKAYEETRHYTTLVVTLGENARPSLPPLEPPVTSFGAAILDGNLYVFGGHLGGAHHYSAEEQSDKLFRLNLKKPVGWETVATAPGRTGTALVAHGGKLYRVGGFVAKNKGEEKQLLESTADFARFDPVSGKWEELKPLPEGRSSHDAVVIGNKLYVVGGWTLNGAEKSVWHDTALVADLSADPIAWKEIPVPFQRRAVSAGEWKGKLVAVGGMQSQGGPTTATAIYDPATQKWIDGPSLQGEKMDGFGSSSFLCGDHLYASTYSGKLQKLSDDGSKWEVVGQLAHPRFFHRMLPTDDGQLLIVGGASMTTGKIRELEILSVGGAVKTAATP